MGKDLEDILLMCGSHKTVPKENVFCFHTLDTMFLSAQYLHVVHSNAKHRKWDRFTSPPFVLSGLGPYHLGRL